MNPQITISVNVNTENFDALKRYGSTEVDLRTWLHVPSRTPWSISSDTHQLVEIWKETSTCYVFTIINIKRISVFCLNIYIYSILKNLHTKTPHELMTCPIDLWAKGQGHNALITENGECLTIVFPWNMSSWHIVQRLPICWWCALLNLGSKGQRSRSQYIDNWKLFMSHNCFLITHIMMDIHTETLNDLRMFPIDYFGKMSNAKVTMHWFLDMIFGT